MCILPSFTAQDLAECKQNRKEEIKKAEAKTVKIIIPDQQLLENSI